MIEFIIYNENKEINKIIEQEIDKQMINTNIDYKTNYYYEFNNNLKNNINNNNFKIYILNQTNISKSGLEIAKYIREEKDDWKSIIIFISKTNEYKLNILTKRLFVLDYILIDDIKTELNKLIKICLKNYDTSPNELKYKYKGINYNILFKEIIYIEKEQDNKRCIIHTKDKKYYIQSTLTKLMTKLDDRFIKSSRTYIINIEQVRRYNIKNNIIEFDDKTQIYEVSRDKKKEIIDKLRRI